MPPPPKPRSTPPRTLLSESRSEVAAALLEHGLDREHATELLDFCELNGDGECLRARVALSGGQWYVDLFGPPAAKDGEAA